MKRKYLVLIIISLLLTGCDIEYNLDLDKQLKLQENINVIATTGEDISKIKEFDLNIPINKNDDDFSAYEKKLDNVNYYNLKKTNEKLSFSYLFEQEEYMQNTLVNGAYEYVSIAQVEDEIVLSSSQGCLLFQMYDNLENLKVTITSNYKLVKTNADEVERHKYTWYINRENAEKVGIYLKLDTTKEDLNWIERLQYFNIFTVSIILFIVGLLVYKILKKKDAKRNEI